MPSGSNFTTFRASRWRGAAAILLACVASIACAKNEVRPDLLLITLDTTRADRLGCYGHAAADTPTLDALAESGVRFEQAHTQVPLTLPAHASLLTGTYARVHGLQINGGGRLGSELPTLGERLAAKGYRTAAFVSSFVLDAEFGLDRGFDVYDDEMGSGEDSVRFAAERRADRVVDAALGWLSTPSERPTFGWIHFYDAHSPYDPPGEYKRRFADPYDGEIAFVDAQLRRVVQWLEQNGRRERTLIVVAGDHGESFGEHDEPEHGLFVYETTIRVPLIFSWPGVLEAGRVVDQAVQLVDLYPTILQLAGAGSEADGNGRSLLAALRGGAVAEEILYGESRYAQIGYGWAPLRFVMRDRWKYIAAPRPELYDRDQDPGEAENLVEARPAEAATLYRELLALERELEPAGIATPDLDDEALEKLRSLGYVGAGPAPATDYEADPTTLPDPKDRVGVYRDHFRADGMLRASRFAEAAALLEQLVARSPESIDLYEDLGWAYLSLGRAAAAQRAYEKSLTNLPEDPERLWGLGESLRRQNDLEGAVRAFALAVANRPDLGEAHMGLTLAYAGQGKFEQAREHARRHVEINPASPIALTNLANVARALQAHDEAIEAARRLIELAPTSRDAHHVLWEALYAAGRAKETIRQLRASLRTLPDDWYLTCALAWMLAVTPEQDAEEAVRLAEQAAQANPRNPRSFDTLAAAYAARGSFVDAERAALRAVALAEGAQARALRAEIEARLELYRAGRPYRE